MAITATFAADFSDFVRGVQQAEGKLGDLQAGAGKIPPAFQQITSSAGGTGNALGSLHQGLNSVDRTLASLGVNIGPQVRALQELASASGKTASQLGLIATAGLTVAAGLGGWQVGRLIADFFDLDETIGNVTAKLLGWGDAAAQVAGAKMDVLTRASKLAGTEITNYAEALKIIKGENDRFADSVNTSAHRVDMWRGEIAKVKADGNIAALTADMASQNSTNKELSEHYGISTRALEFFGRENKVAADAVKKHADEMEKAKEKAEALAAALKKAEAAALAKMYSDIGNEEQMIHMNDAIAAQARQLENANGLWLMGVDAVQQASEAKANALAQEKADAAEYERLMDGMVTVIGKLPPAFAAAGAAAVASAQATEMSWGQAMASVSAGLGVMTGTIQNATGKGGVTRYDDYNNPYTHIPGVNAPGRMSPGGLAGFAEGGPVLQDGPIYAHAGEYVLPRGGGGSVIVNVDARESFYDTPASLQRLGEKISAAVTATMRNRGAVAG